MNTGLWNMDSGLAAPRRPGMTTEAGGLHAASAAILRALATASSIVPTM
jgi:hypothetical protein